MKAKSLVLMVLLATQAACARSGSGTGTRMDSSNPKTLESLARATAAEVQIKQRLEDEISAASGAGCDFSDRYKQCKMVEIGFAPARLQKASEGQRVLVLDENFITPALLTRHRDRVLDLLVQKQDGTYRRAAPKYRIPEVAVQLNDILRTSPSPIRNEALGETAETLAAFYIFATKNTSNESTGTTHGEVVFETLAKYNPQAQFLIAPFPIITESAYCRIGEEEIQNDVRELYINAANDLVPRMKELQISHANVSWAITDATARTKFGEMCGHYPNEDEIDGLNSLVLAQANFVRDLAKRTKILVAQAAPNDYKGDFDPHEVGTSWSCLANANVVSVGYLGFLNSGLQPGGNAIDQRWIPYQQRSSSDCTDVFVNGGIHETYASQANEDYSLGYGKWWNEFSFVENLYSFTSSPARILSNSWLTPVALSMIIHMEQEAVRNGLPRPTAAEMTKKLRGRMFDPIANFQTELQHKL